jgi:hypothetical protein
MSDSLTVSSQLSTISTALREQAEEYSSTDWWETETISDQVLGPLVVNSGFDCNWLAVQEVCFKRRKVAHTDGEGYLLDSWFPETTEGRPIKKESDVQDSIIYHDYEETEPFNPYFISPDPLEQYKYGLQVDKLSGVKRLKEPKRWCVLPVSETTVQEVPLTFEDEEEYNIVQIQGHVAFSKATYYVDKQVYPTKIATVHQETVYKTFRLTVQEVSDFADEV